MSATSEAIPVPDATYDAIVFTQVMEHLSEPALVLKEFHRVADGCRLFYSAPLCAEEHEVPYDFYRYTQFGIRHLFTKAGFEVDEIRWLEGSPPPPPISSGEYIAASPGPPEALGGGFNAWAVVVMIVVLKPLLRF